MSRCLMITVTVSSAAIRTKAFGIALTVDRSGPPAARAGFFRSRRKPMTMAPVAAAAPPMKLRRETRGVRAPACDRPSVSMGLLQSGRMRESGEGARGFVNCRADALVGAAAADVAVHGAIDVGVGGFLVIGQEADGRHDLAGLAVAALDHVELAPRALNRLGDPPGYALDRRDLGLADILDRRLAGAHRLPVEMDRAGAALGDAAAILGARLVEMVAQDPEERRLGVGIDLVRDAVDRQLQHRMPLRIEP